MQLDNGKEVTVAPPTPTFFLRGGNPITEKLLASKRRDKEVEGEQEEDDDDDDLGEKGRRKLHTHTHT